MGGRRVGVFGGTFDPPHHGHLIVAAEAFEVLELNLLLFVPAADPPHKAAVAGSPDQRLRMVQAAVAGDPRFEVDEIELERGGPSYTVDTLRAITAREPDAELIFLLGIDQFRKFASWRDPSGIVRIARLAVLSRGGETPHLSGPYEAVHVPVTRIDLSSSALRERVAAGMDLRHHVPRAVLEIIEGEGLYRERH